MMQGFILLPCLSHGWFLFNRETSLYRRYVVYSSGLAVVLAVVRHLGWRLDRGTGHDGVVVLEESDIVFCFFSKEPVGQRLTVCAEWSDKGCWVA